MKSFALLSFCGLLALSACGGCGGNPFAPRSDKSLDSDDSDVIGPPAPSPLPEATTPEQLMDNLARAMRTRDKDLYESLLDKDFLFTEWTIASAKWSSPTTLKKNWKMMAGSRDGSQPGIFDVYPRFLLRLLILPAASQELGSEHPESYPGDPNGHPDEDWEVFYGRVQMLLLDDNGDGYRVDQNMTYKLRLDPNDEPVENHPLGSTIPWGGRLRREPPASALANALSWAALKQKVAP